jgi:DNA invertase Pin-like site-specific DNA recombinase
MSSAVLLQNTAATYERVSTFVQSFGYSLKTQGKTVDQIAAERGLVIPTDLRFVDGDEGNASGADWDLKDLNRMLDAAKARRMTWLLVPDDQRFARDMTKALVLEQMLAAYGVTVIYANIPVDASTPEGGLLRNQLHAFAQYDREKRRFVTMRTRREKALNQTPVGNGPPPYGYRWVRWRPHPSARERVLGMEVVREEAQVVQSVFTSAKRLSARRIARQLNADEVPNPGRSRGIKGAAEQWTPEAIIAILHNTLYKGAQRYHEAIVSVPAIVDERLWQDVEDALASRHRKPGSRFEADDPFLLRGRLICGVCSRPLRTEAWKDSRYYRCANLYKSRLDEHTPRCPVPSFDAVLVEDTAWHLLVREVFDPARLALNLASSRGRYAEAERQQADRLAAVQVVLDKQRRIVTRAVERINALDPDDEGDRIELQIQEQARDQAKTQAARAARELENLRSPRATEGLSPSDEAALLAIVDELRADADLADVESRRQVLALLHVGGVVWPESDERGQRTRVALRGRRQWARVAWTGELALGTEGALNKLHLVFSDSTMRVVAA